MITVTVIYSWKVHEERGGPGGDSHTHSPAEARDQGSPLQALGARGDASATTQTVASPTRLPVFLFALKSPAPLVIIGRDNGGD